MNSHYQNRVLGYFSSIAIANDFDVEIFVGKPQGLEIRSKEGLFAKVLTEVNSFGKLYIRMEEGFIPNHRPHIIIHTHVLNSLYIRNTVSASVLDIKGQHFSFEGTDTSQSNLIGHVENFKINMFGSAKLNAIELEAKNISVSCNHTSQIRLFAHNTIAGSAYGRSYLHYKGNPELAIFNAGQSFISAL
ncbi:DUF2807 domain-containing protein [Pigmentibacter sp. JX0631]|uniref:GIN domain-containing protein n=1 Tax=Pigmentibacter sp. JX0631 TaxID=2976982 RepID=UPI002468A169|nr:DUF2807 domain-containing protein [Pigmentibacter sp. JX0631]WGL61117.1 DUF2807 domain-containing protein [Pigmentibacter sp. JX0631]